MQRAQHRLRLLIDHPEKYLGRAFGMAPALLPVPHGRGADAKHGGETVLAQPKFLPHRRHVDRGHLNNVGRAARLVALNLGDGVFESRGDVVESFLGQGYVPYAASIVKRALSSCMAAST